MEESSEIGNIGVKAVTEYLFTLPSTIAVINVEADDFFRKKDIDLIWLYKKQGKVETKMLEVKTDTYHRTGNYFLETVSNKRKNSKGCFLYTEADYFCYYFPDIRELNFIPIFSGRKWFLDNISDFKDKETSTSYDGGKYFSKGKLVDRKRMNKEVKVKTLYI